VWCRRSRWLALFAVRLYGQGVAMVSGVLGRNCTIQLSPVIMRALVKLRELLSAHKDQAARPAAGISVSEP